MFIVESYHRKRPRPLFNADDLNFSIVFNFWKATTRLYFDYMEKNKMSNITVNSAKKRKEVVRTFEITISSSGTTDYISTSLVISTMSLFGYNSSETEISFLALRHLNGTIFCADRFFVLCTLYITTGSHDLS